jgi:hypothetical protein
VGTDPAGDGARAPAPVPGLVHFYSYVTGVSIELPVGFEFVGEDESSATYADRSEGGASSLVRVRVLGTVDAGAEPAAVRALADGFAALDGDVLDRREREVDGSLVATVVLRRPDGTLLHQSAAADSGRLVAIVATAPAGSFTADAYDGAIESIRFIAL